MRKTIIWTFVLLVAAASAWAERPVDAGRAVRPDATIKIDNMAGSLTIVGVEGGEVRVTGTLGDDVEELDISGDSDEISIEVVIPDGGDWRGRRKIAARLEVEVPRGASLEVETVSATIDIRGVDGEIEAGSVSGAVTAAGGNGKIELESVSGEVTLSGGSGSIVAESVSGRLTLRGVSGDIEATTVSGEIRIEGAAANDVEIESVAGGVYFAGAIRDGLEVDSHSGNVRLVLPADLSADFELETFSGRIDNGFGPPARRTDRYEPGLSAEFSTGDGAEVSIQTFSGNIVLEKS